MSRERAAEYHHAGSPHERDEEYERIKKYEDFTTIDWIQDAIVERNRRLRTSRKLHSSYIGHGRRWEVAWAWTWSKFSIFADAAQSWFVVSLVGVCIGVNAALISIVTAWLSDLKMGYCHDGWWLNRQFCCWEIENDDAGCDSWHRWSTVLPVRWTIYVIFAATFCFTAAHLVRSIAKYAAGSGISEIKCILGGFIMKGYLGVGTFFVKSITLPLVIASGLSVGKEGPSVHVACCIGYLVASLFRRYHLSQGKMREVLTASSAAGVAVAFGSPIGGVLFSIEEMSSVFSIKTMWRSFFCALMATVTLSAMNPYRSGKLVLFQVTYDRDWHFFEIIFFVILGIFGGLYGAFVVKFNLQVAAFRRKHLSSFPVSEAVILATITAMVGYFNRFVRIDMTESMSILFRECQGVEGDYDNICQTSEQWPMVNSLFLATILRMGLVVVSYGCKVPAGIFVPSMAIGATFGRMVGIMVKALYRAYPESSMFAVCQLDVQCITPGTYAFLGAAAALSGIMRLTIMVVVIMFELTGALTYILPTMIVLLVTKAVGDFLGTTGIADEMIRFNGYPFLERDDEAYDVPVSRVMKTELHTIPASGICIRDVEERLKTSDVKGFPVVSADGTNTLIGYIDRAELRYVLDKARRVQNISSATPCSFASDQDDHDQIEFQVDFPGMPTGPALGIDEDISMEILETTATPGVLKFWPWVNQTPFTVSPQLPLEIAMQMFKRMGPRVILVEDRGELLGLVTVKDVLLFTLAEHSQTKSPWGEAEFEGILEEVWTWTTDRFYAFISYCRALVRR
ncbi:Cl-channel protein [Rhodofomes roseus]|uniref:Chloride channel protein n=1 Tax=Rhodofomes roseus TaxID=34475 RepID=A0ABQ8KLG6_9APHY|nr:Cl-channel protein [Rhodofomes roseus]KAH9839164.1 Cl-channel protein [Rhodofomes roseus]